MNQVNDSNKLEIAALTCGVLSIVLCCCGGIPGVVGLALCVVAVRKGKKTGKTIIAFVCSIVGVIGTLMLIAFLVSDSGKEMWDGCRRIISEYGDLSGMDDEIHRNAAREEIGMDIATSVKMHEGTNNVSSKVAAKVVIDDKTIVIPCKLSDVLELYSVSEVSEIDLDTIVESEESKILYLDAGEEESGIYVIAENNSKKAVKDAKKLTVTSISIDNNPSKEVLVLGELTLGMTSEELENAIDDLSYNKSEMNNFVFYTIYVGDNEDYFVTLMLTDDKISNISIYYSKV